MSKRRRLITALVLESIVLSGFAAIAIVIFTASGEEVHPSSTSNALELTHAAHMQGILSAYSETSGDATNAESIKKAANELADAYLILLQTNESYAPEDRTQTDLLIMRGIEIATSIAQDTQLLQESTSMLNSTMVQLAEFQSPFISERGSQQYDAVLIGVSIAGLALCLGLIALIVVQLRHKQPISASEYGEELPAEIKESIDPQSGGVTGTVFELIMPREIHRMKRYGHSLSLLSLRIDQLSDLILSEGEDGAAYVITSLGETIAANTRASDLFARIAQNRFILVLPETDGKGALKVAEKIRRNVEIFPYDTDTQCTISAGVAQCIEDEDMERLLGRAENASSNAHAAGGNKILQSE